MSETELEAPRAKWTLHPPRRHGGAPTPASPYRQVVVHEKTVTLAPVDALALFGALAMAVDGETAHITLASGDVLDLTHQEVSDLGRQLAGKPADEVSG